MKCDKCDVNEAEIYLGYLQDETGEQIFLCVTCAAESDVKSLLPEKGNTLSTLKSKRILQNDTYFHCPGCSTALETILTTRLVGCPLCYSTFRKEIRFLEISGEVNEPVRH